jgi:hypothetical protein
MSSDNTTNSQQNDVHAFLTRARAINSHNRTIVRLPNIINNNELSAPRCLAREIEVSDTFNNKAGREVIASLLISFDQLCIQNNIKYPEDLREQISKTLIEELYTNARVFIPTKDPAVRIPKYCVSLTLYHGTSMCSIIDEKEFEPLRYPFGIENKEGIGHELLYPFSQAALHRPINPRKFLRRALDTLNRIMNNKEYAFAHSKPNHIVESAISCPSDPEKYLTDMYTKNSGLPYISGALDNGDEILIEIMRYSKNVPSDDLPHD